VIVFVNSKQQEIPDGATLAELLELLGFERQRVAVEANGELVTRNDWAQYKLKAGDRLEIVSFVGGG
jgi:thiamine biosynthesis protein ThiS